MKSAAAARTALICYANGVRLALPTDGIVEVVRPRPLTRVPNAPASLLGIANLRGLALPVMSLAKMLGADAGQNSAASRIIVVDRGQFFGVWVDRVGALTGGEDDTLLVALDDLLAEQFGSAGRSPAPIYDRGHPQDSAQAPPEASRALVAFVLGGQEFALPLEDVSDIMAFPATFAPVPGTDSAMLGIASAGRHDMLPLVSLRTLLGLAQDGQDFTRAHIVVTRVGHGQAGLVVDGMRPILRVREDAIGSVPPLLTRGAGEARIQEVCRIEGGRRLVLLLSPDRLFDGETMARVVQAAGAAAPPTVQAADGEPTHELVVFRIGADLFGLPVDVVDEVVRRPTRVARVPHAPDFLEGMMNLRGRVVPLIDQRRRFATNSSAPARRVIVMTAEGAQAGFGVDAVIEVLRVKASELVPAPPLSAEDAPLFQRIAQAGSANIESASIKREGRMILLIDAATLMNGVAKDLVASLAASDAADVSA